jgi:SAM-dependent methyltransferase
VHDHVSHLATRHPGDHTLNLRLFASKIASLLACPCDGMPLTRDGRVLRCSDGHAFPIVDDVPILLRGDVPQTIGHPIPDIRLPQGQAKLLLDVGCSWGRWSIAARRKGYSPVGLDPSLGAVLAARRIADSLGLAFYGVVGDARILPFRAGSLCFRGAQGGADHGGGAQPPELEGVWNEIFENTE